MVDVEAVGQEGEGMNVVYGFCGGSGCAIFFGLGVR